MPRKPKLMLNSCGKLSRGRSIDALRDELGGGRGRARPGRARSEHRTYPPPATLRTTTLTTAPDARFMPPTARRAPDNPILTPSMVPPSRPDLEVVGVFNP